MAERQQPLESLREHPLASLVPEMSSDEYQALLADIAAHGVEQPLEITKSGLVLDGRHRLRAARELAHAHVPVRLVAPVDEEEYIVRAAITRRHLSIGQRAAVVVALQQFQHERALASARQRANLKHHVEVTSLSPRRGRTRELAARIAGVSAGTIQTVLRVRAADPELFEQIKRGALTPAAAQRQLDREQRYARIGSAPAMPAGPFDLLYADPPWQLGNPSSDYAPEQYYPTMPLEQIKALPVPAADDALLYLWAVNSHVPEAIQVLEAWGFAYRGFEVWVKPSIGMGVWTRYRHEPLLIGCRGKASPPPRHKLLDSVIQARRGRHSEKPACVYERLEHLYPERSKVELFARGKPRPGWTAWGNEVEHTEAA